ncbi:MAG: nuclear transport factor 2 family protein [Chloroflexi bacterium]|nr:nuclear transport factor 2 family protein [Chloroflexota bacterium]
MTDDDRHNTEAVKRMYGGDVAENATIASDIVWHVPGHNPVSGEYRGYKDYTELMPSRMAPLARWDFELGDVMVNGSYVVATFRLQGERKGKTIILKGAHIMRLNDRHQVVEGWGFTDDQAALDDFFSA